MITLIADNAPLSLLASVVEPVEILDEQGAVLGQFTPTEATLEKGRILYEKARMLFASRPRSVSTLSADQCKTTAEVLKMLKELAAQSAAGATPAADLPAGRQECTTP